MEPANFLTIGLSNLLDGLITNAFNKRGSLENIGRYESIQKFLNHSATVDRTIIIMEPKISEDCLDALRQYQKVRLVCVENSAKSFSLWKLEPRQQTLGEMSPDELIKTILSED